MKLPFQITNTFTTALSRDEIIDFVESRLHRRSKYSTTNDYIGSVEDTDFNFYKYFNPRTGCSNAKIRGTIIASNPTTLTITVSPHYSRVLLFLLFPIIFIPVAIFSQQMTINGVLKEPELSDRIIFGLGGCIPIIWCYVDSIKPIKEAETWIKNKLILKKVN